MDESNRFISNSDHDPPIQLDSDYFQSFKNGPNRVSVFQLFLIVLHIRWGKV